MQKRNGFCDDINWSKLGEDFCMYLIVFCLIAATLFCSWQDHVDASNKEYNRTLEFNALSYKQRVIIAEWEGFEVDEDCLRPLEVPMDYLLATVLGAIVAVLVAILATSTRTLASLYMMKNDVYFLADLPPTKSAGQTFLLCFSLIAGCPFLIVSYVRMRRWEKVQEANLDEQNTNAQDVNMQYTNTDDQEESLQAFIEYRRTFNQNYYQEQLIEAEGRIRDLEARLKCAGEQVRSYQNQLRTAKQDHLKIQDTLEHLQDHPVDELIADWRAIKKMRGVTSIHIEPSKNPNQPRLCIDVTVHAPYEDKVYDCGEYEIQIDDVCADCDNGWECIILRDAFQEHCQTDSGSCIEQNCEFINGCCADYIAAGDIFCFGDRTNSISEYFRKGQFRAAIILIIDSLHSVNDPETAKSIPYCYQPITDTEGGNHDDEQHAS